MTAPPDGSPDVLIPAPTHAPRDWFLLGALVIVLAALWRFTPLATLLDREHLADVGRVLDASPALVAAAFVVPAFVAATLVLFPMTPLLAATAMVLEPWRALGLGLAGALAAAAVGYAAGRLVARRRPRWVEGVRFAPLRARLRRRGIVTMAVSRLVPVGNFTLANAVAGAIGVPFRDFMLGNALGLLPVLLAFTVLSRWLHHVGVGWPS